MPNSKTRASSRHWSRARTRGGDVQFSSVASMSVIGAMLQRRLDGKRDGIGIISRQKRVSNPPRGIAQCLSQQCWPSEIGPLPYSASREGLRRRSEQVNRLEEGRMLLFEHRKWSKFQVRVSQRLHVAVIDGINIKRSTNVNDQDQVHERRIHCSSVLQHSRSTVLGGL